MRFPQTYRCIQKDGGDLIQIKQQVSQALIEFITKQQPSNSLLKANNLADFPDEFAAWQNLGLNDAALISHKRAELDEMVADQANANQ